MKPGVIFIFGLIAIFIPLLSIQAQQLPGEVKATWIGEIIEIIRIKNEKLGDNAIHEIQVLNVKILNGPREGELVEIDNDFLPLKIGQKVYINYLKTDFGN